MSNRTGKIAAVVFPFVVALALGCQSNRSAPARAGGGGGGGAVQAAARVDAGAAADIDARRAVTADQAWASLVEGNRRFVAGASSHPRQSPERRAETAGGQRPFAVVLACADSRVGPEVVFDQGVGDLFVVRVAGNIADDAVLGSIEYAAEHLHTPLIVVMGHTECGAVAAAVETVATNSTPPGHLGALIDPIRPAIVARPPGAGLDQAIDANVRNTVEQIRTSGPILDHLVREGTVKVIGGRYDIATGEFRRLDAGR